MNVQVTQLTIFEFSTLLKNFRAKARMTQKDLSEKIGVGLQTIFKWENMYSFPKNITTLKKIARILRLPVHNFLEIKDVRKSERVKSLILKSKDPVVAYPWVNCVPLLDRKIKVLPFNEIKDPALWKAQRYQLPAGLFPGFIFAFKITDKSMEPVYRTGDVVIADVRKTKKEEYLGIVKVKGHPPVCRLYSDKGKIKILKTVNPAIPAVRVRESDVEWCCPILESKTYELN